MKLLEENHEVLKEMAKDVNGIKLDIGEIKVDVRHHIKRSDNHEVLIVELNKFKERALGAVALLMFLATMITIYEVLR